MSRQKRRKHYTVKQCIISLLKYFSLIFVIFWMLIPVVSCILTAFKSTKEYNQTSVATPPKNWFYFDNFVTAWTKGNMGRAFLNSIIILVFVLAGSILIGTMLAYILNRFKFLGNGFIRNLFLFAALIPGVAVQVTVFSIMTSLNLVNTLLGYIILLMGTDVISIYVFLQYFENISVSLDESAIVDGASYYTVFFRILLPLLKPAIVTCMILKGVSTYNEYYMANLYLQSDKLKVVSSSLYTFTGPFGNQYNYICAGVIITVLPALVVFITYQNKIYNGLTRGAVKG